MNKIKTPIPKYLQVNDVAFLIHRNEYIYLHQFHKQLYGILRTAMVDKYI